MCPARRQQLTFFNQAWEIGPQAWAGVRSKFSTRRRESWQVYLLQKSTSTLNLKHMYIVQCTIYNTKCRNAHCKKNLLIILVHPTWSFISWVSFYFTNIHESHNKSYRVWEKKFESSNTPHICMKLTFSWTNYFNFHFD